MHPPRVYTCSQSWTRLPPPSPYHPSGASQCTSPKLLVSCIEPGLQIHFLYDIVHVFHYMLVPNNKNNGIAHVKSELPFHLKIRRSSSTNQHYLAGDGSSYSLDMMFTHLHLLLGVYSAKKDCRGPAPADPGSSKGRRHQRLHWLYLNSHQRYKE